MQQVQQALGSLLVLGGIALGTVAAVAVVLGIVTLGLVVLDQVRDAYDVPLVAGD